jgi:CRISPR system Cascade subunit CasB
MEKTDQAVVEHLQSWWEGLEDRRAERAILKRAPSLTAVALSAPYQKLYRELLALGWPELEAAEANRRNDRLAAAVGLLANVRGEQNGTQQRNGELKPAKAMSRKDKDSDRPVVSELRFRRLLESPDLDSLFAGLRRVLPMFGSHINVADLAADILHWGDGVKKRWAYQYDWPEKAGDA